MDARITWFHKGTNNAACIGLDEVIKDVSDKDTEDELREAAIYHAETQGVKVELYDVAIDFEED